MKSPMRTRRSTFGRSFVVSICFAAMINPRARIRKRKMIIIPNFPGQLSKRKRRLMKPILVVRTRAILMLR